MAFRRFFSPRNKNNNVYQLPLRPAATTNSPTTDGVSHTSPTVQPSGTKRSRSGRPISPPPLSSSPTKRTRDAHDPSRTCSSPRGEHELWSSSLSSDDDSDGSVYSDEEYTLPPNHEFQSIRVDVVRVAYTRAYAWMACANYGPSSENVQIPDKRARTTGRQPRLAHIEEHQDSVDSFVFISHLDGHYRLSCPFYLNNSIEYGRCVLHHDLQSVEAVIDHVCSDHMEPPCCAMCYRVFDRAMDRDHHMSKNTCELRSPVPIDGINVYQKEKLVKRDRVYLGEKKRWYRIWKTVFPSSAPPRSPYLEKGVGLELSMVRDYWAKNGRDCLSQYLTKRGLLRQQREDDERALAALGKLSLQDLLAKVFEERGAA